MIYTIGYASATLDKVLEIMERKGVAVLIDVRSVPYTRNPAKHEFNRNRLEKRLGDRYLWMGDKLGGKHGTVKESGIKALVLQSDDTLLLMCLEAHPCDCHRLYDIGRRLLKKGIDAVHIFDGDCEKKTSELTKEACDERNR